jgi:hypothetical protein
MFPSSSVIKTYISNDDALTKIIRVAAKYFILIWAILWTIFIWISAISEGFTHSGLISTLIFTIGFLGSALLPWKFETIGSIILFLGGLAAIVFYSSIDPGTFTVSLVFTLIITLALPPYIAGALLFLVSRRSRLINHPPETPNL